MERLSNKEENNMAVNNSLVRQEETFSTFLTKDAIKNKINQTLGV